MSQATMRRQDKAMSQTEIEALLARVAVGHFGTRGTTGDPYVVPNLFVYLDGQIYTHTSSAGGHFRQNIEQYGRGCFEVSEMGQVWPYGEFECDTTISYASVICYGSISIVDEPTAKARFFDHFMAKYADPTWERPKSFYPRLAGVTVYRLGIETITGKKGPLPAVAEQWPAKNKTLSPHARPPTQE